MHLLTTTTHLLATGIKVKRVTLAKSLLVDGSKGNSKLPLGKPPKWEEDKEDVFESNSQDSSCPEP